MANLTGTLSPLSNIEFTAVENNANLLKGMSSIVLTDSNGAYSVTIANGVYNIEIGNRQYKSVNINADGSLNDFLGDANGRNM